MSLKTWILSRYIAERIRKEIGKMKPLPKAFGWFGALGALISAIGLGAKTGDWTGLVPALGAVIALFSHSANGTGGQPE